MSTLQTPTKESPFGGIGNNDTTLIKQFLKENYKINGTYDTYVIYENNGTSNIGCDVVVVSVDGDVRVKNRKIESLTGGLFRFGAVSGDFNCSFCSNITNLEGAPK